MVATGIEVLEIPSYISGYHAYVSMWTPVLGQTLLLKREPTNNKDKNAVAVYLEDVVVGHVPHNIAPRYSQFLLRDVNKAFAEVYNRTESQPWSRLRARSPVCLQTLWA